MKATHPWSTLIAALILAAVPLQTLSAEGEDDAREQTNELILGEDDLPLDLLFGPEQRADALNAEDRSDESENAARQAKELQAKAREAAEAAREREIERRRSHEAELHAPRKNAEAEEVRRRARELANAERERSRQERAERLRRERLEGLDQSEGPRGEFPDRRPPSPPPRAPWTPEGGDAPRRLHHLQQAIEHLRAAGLHEPAEEIERQADHLRQDFKRRGDFPAVPEGMRESHAAIRELHETMAELRQQLDELRHELENVRGLLKRRPEEAR